VTRGRWQASFRLFTRLLVRSLDALSKIPGIQGAVMEQEGEVLAYIGRRIVQMIPLLIGLSIIIWFIIQLPPGDYLTTRILELEQRGGQLDTTEVERLRRLYNLDKPSYQRYLLWVKGIVLEGDLGLSMEKVKPVNEIVGDRLALTVTISVLTLALTWAVAIPIGIYSAVHQYSAFDYLFTFVGFVGVSIPGFFIALVILYGVFVYTGQELTGLFSAEFARAPWSWAKAGDLLKHIWLPMVIIGVSGTTSLIRVMRGMMLDELQKQYVVTARAKGLPERRLLVKYPIRLAINPIISTVGWLLPSIVSGEVLVSTVLNLPTIGPLMLHAMLVQDMSLAGSVLLLLAVLTIIGTLLSDILLVWLDPRIRYGGMGEET
jgi:peptide/nickel transport system permease protein